MRARKIVEQTFIEPFRKKESRFVGTELEFPLVTLSGEPLDMQIIQPFLQYILKNGFTIEETDIEGNGVFLTNRDGDCLSFDNSYNNFEFAMEKGENLLHIAKRFYHLFELVQAFLLPNGYTLCGLGTNPRFSVSDPLPVAYPIYGTIREFLSEFSGPGFHNIPYFPAWLSSVQTHLDVSAERLPKALTVMAALDFVRGLLFSNALPLVDNEVFCRTVCFRDYLWEHSGFGSLADNTGPVCGAFTSCDDIVDMILKKSMFLRRKNEAYVTMPPVSVLDYFDGGAPESDISAYLSFKNVEVTRRGTLEMRSDCAQPIGAAFAPPAFNLGIFMRLDEAEKRLQTFFDTLPKELATAKDRNAVLRRKVIYGVMDFAEEDVLRALLLDLVLLAEEGLLERGLGEEKLLIPLTKRAVTLTCPAKLYRRRLQEGEKEDALIRDFADPQKVF